MNRLKFILPIVFAFMLSTASQAQLPDGAVAPDWTATDIDGIEHNL